MFTEGHLLLLYINFRYVYLYTFPDIKKVLCYIYFSVIPRQGQ